MRCRLPGAGGGSGGAPGIARVAGAPDMGGCEPWTPVVDTNEGSCS
jgi:hypothetical protein